jgi:hypothetical protein
MKFLAIGVYFIVLLVLGLILLAPIVGFGTWSNADQAGYAADIKPIAFILLLLMVAGGLYFLWRNTPSFG